MKPELKVFIVQLILDGRVEKALELLAEYYRVDVPKIKVGLPKGRRKKTLGCYNAKKGIIFILNSDTLKEPFIILHEFYHHLRTTLDTKHKGTEKYADEFARGFILAYKSMAANVAGNN
ncbi:hypothetical protein E3J49_07675 [Candidatus Bathyarchaeota archaeon]|nr:MAG: hypothetical protein E3J49_07675 [Candidatus Bathyarchaeota archaeon]